MGTTNYISLGETIIGEESVGAGRVDYATDALGSVTGTLVGGALQNVYFHNPYGSLMQQSGPGADPKFLWVGSKGYRQTNRGFATTYVRARHYSSSNCRWITADPLWPKQMPYSYGICLPTTLADPGGLCSAIVSMQDEGAVIIHLTRKCSGTVYSEIDPTASVKDCDDFHVDIGWLSIVKACWKKFGKKEEGVKCINENLTDAVNEAFWDWLQCYIGSCLDPTSGHCGILDPCKQDTTWDCNDCCQGKWYICMLQCVKKHGAEEWTSCIDSCGQQESACMEAC